MRTIKLLSVLGLSLALATPVLAADPAPSAAPADKPVAKPADPDAWRFNGALYGWLISVAGNVTSRGQTIDTNASFIDLVQQSQSLGAFMGYFEADKGKAGLYLDLVYTNLGFGAYDANYRNPIGGLKITTAAKAALTYQLIVAELGGVYELARWQHSENSSTAIDGLMGFRYWNNSISAGFDAVSNVDFSRLNFDRSFGISVAREDAIQWVDPVFGFRVRHEFTPNQRFEARGDIGGFGLGSQLTWQAVGVYSYAWSLDNGAKLAALFGFRALGVNYSSGWGLDTVAINETLYGPIVGLSYRF
jgi:hypothetical protein